MYAYIDLRLSNLVRRIFKFHIMRVIQLSVEGTIN